MRGGKQGPAWRRRGAGVALVISAALAGACLEPGHVTCSDGALCPAGWTCLATGCVSPAQIAACDGLGDGDACTFAGVEGACRDGGCFDARCGDGQLGADEVCDDGNRIDGDGCSADCASDETCGNAVRDQAEACDLGADNSADPDAACRPDCTRPGCGDGVVDPSGGEACDDGAANDLAPDAACRPNCQPRRCSDGVTDPAAGEACDDGNLVPGDGCSFDCVSDETCGNGATDYLEGELCDDGNARPHDGCDRSCQPERATWSQVGVTPGARGYAATAFDLARGQLVMFGGRSAAGLLADTWVHADLDWRLVPTPNGAPPARQGAAAAFDSDRGVVVLFGGVADSGLLADTWEFDGAGWREVAVPAGPPAREFTAMAYDPILGRTVLYGGRNAGGLLNDTWLFDGETWTDAAPFIGAGTRSHHGMAFDAARGKVAVWGGYFDAAATLIQAPFLYHYDGNVWAMTSAVATPPSRACPAMVFDARQGELRIFGGENSPTGTTHADAWAFNGTTWTQVTASGHQAAGAAMGFDPIRERSVIFGGRLTGGAMSAATYALGAVGPLVALSAGTAPPPRFLTSAAYDEGAGELVIFGGRTAAATSLGDTWTWDGMRWTLETPATSPSPRTGAALAYDQAGSRVVLFGGYPGSGETWIWNGVTWTLLPLAGGPASLSTTHSMVYDATREAVVLGHVEGTFALVGDAWVELDDVALDSGVRLAYQPGGVGLLQVGPATLRFDDDAWLDGGLDPELPSRNAPSVAYAAGRGELVVFGGYGAAGALADTWTSNGQRWQVALTATRPIARGMAATAYDPVRDEVVLTGGSNGGGGAYGDTWRLRWLGDLADEACAWHQDLDGDGLVACDDPDCWPACAPTCPPVLADAGTCDPTDPATLSGPHCGDGACATWEGPRLCPSDCATAPPMCGDAWCDDGETDVSCPADC